MANLLVEIGNTALKAVWSEEKILGRTFRYQGEKKMDFILSLIEKERPEILAVASVENISPEDEKTLKEKCSRLVLMDAFHKEILSEYGFPDSLSYDRALSLVAASRIFAGKACMVFDFGTTLTVDFMDGKGIYKGGNISLGCMTRLKALNRYSKALPLVQIPGRTVAAGFTTEESVGAGVVSGIMFEIDGYIRSNPGNIVVFTGGDAAYFAEKMNSPVFVVSNLVMMGLSTVTDDYVKKNI